MSACKDCDRPDDLAEALEIVAEELDVVRDAATLGIRALQIEMVDLRERFGAATDETHALLRRVLDRLDADEADRRAISRRLGELERRALS